MTTSLRLAVLGAALAFLVQAPAARAQASRPARPARADGSRALARAQSGETSATPAAPAPAPAPASASTPASRPLKTVVGDFVLAGAAHPDLARVLSDAAAKGVDGTPGLTVMGQSELVAILGLERTRRMLGCSDEQGCSAELATVVEAERLVAGSFTLLDRTALLTVRFIDVRKNQTIARTTATLVDATEPELVDAARRLAHEAVTGQKLDTTGSLRITVNRAGADVTLDGRSIGASPVAAVRVQEGPHTVTVQKAGHIRWSSSVIVKAGHDAAVQADLVPLQVLGETARSRLWTWGWISSGVAVAGGAAALYFGNQADASHRKYVSATERSTAVDLHDQTRQWTTLTNASWGVAGVGALSAAGLLAAALVQDARAHRALAAEDARPAPSKAPGAPNAPAKGATVVPLPGGAAVAVAFSF